MEIMQANFIRSFTTLWIGVFAISTCSAGEAPPDRTRIFSVQLSQASRFKNSESLIEVVLRNHSSQDVYFITRTFPFNGTIRTNIFEITDVSGKRMEYLGISRADDMPTDEKKAYTLLRKGEEYKCSVDLSRYYDFSGDRYVRMEGVLLYLPAEGFEAGTAAQFERFASNTILVKAKMKTWIRSIFEWLNK